MALVALELNSDSANPKRAGTVRQHRPALTTTAKVIAMPAFIDITGQRYGRLVALRVEPSTSIRTHWRCACDCGQESVVNVAYLRNGDTKSCGCYQRECISAAHRIHGQSASAHGGKASRLYTIWNRMRSRCVSPNNKDYARYGGRGISVCPEWGAFLAFERWALTSGYADNLTIDRINNDGNYTPKNCRWADAKAQARNRPGYVTLVFYKRKTACLAEHVEDCGLPYSTVQKRLKLGWSFDRAFQTPLRKKVRL